MHFLPVLKVFECYEMKTDKKVIKKTIVGWKIFKFAVWTNCSNIKCLLNKFSMADFSQILVLDTTSYTTFMFFKNGIIKLIKNFSKKTPKEVKKQLIFKFWLTIKYFVQRLSI